MMRILVCGDRNWQDRDMIYEALDQLPEDTEIIEGGASGADTLARRCALDRGLEVVTYWAAWQKYRRPNRRNPAGPIRNKKMLDSGIDLVLAFHDDLAHSKGTKDMVARAKKAGVRVKTFRH